MSYETVLVLGGTGFLGKNLQEVKPDWIYAGRTCHIQNGVKCEYWPIEEIKYDRPGEVRELIEQFDPDAVINLAADVGGIEYNNTNQLSIYENNILINTNIIKACRELEIDRVLSCLSTCAFPNDGVFPMNEYNLFHNSYYDDITVHPFKGHMGYGWAKRMLHLHSQLAREAGYNYSTFAPSNLYGPHDHMGESSSHFVAALVHKISELKEDDKLNLFGDGKALRQFLYAPDLAQIIPELLEKHNSDVPLIVAPDENLSIDEMAKIALEVVNKDNEIVYNGDNLGQHRKDASNQMLRKLLGEFSPTSFRDGFKKTYEWYMENK